MALVKAACIGLSCPPFLQAFVLAIAPLLAELRLVTSAGGLGWTASDMNCISHEMTLMVAQHCKSRTSTTLQRSCPTTWFVFPQIPKIIKNRSNSSSNIGLLSGNVGLANLFLTYLGIWGIGGLGVSHLCPNLEIKAFQVLAVTSGSEFTSGRAQDCKLV
eukprot:5405888-Amphidinium_carterae.1